MISSLPHVTRQVAVPTQSNGHAVASMVLGILSIMFYWLFDIVGLTMAIQPRSRP
jgi:hypothetical protein